MSKPQNSATTQAIDIAIRLGMIFLIVAWCLQILMPFISMIIWGGIIAVAIYTPFLKLADKLGGKKKKAATLITLGTIVAILVPVVMLSGSLIDSATSLGTQITDGTLVIPSPSENVSSWPVIGDKVYTFWHDASVNLSATVEQHSEQLSHIGLALLSLAAGVGVGVLQFIVSMIIAGIFLTSAETVTASMHKFAKRLVGQQGEHFLSLSTSTVRSVAVGVLGIAVVQAIMAGVGMMAVGVPGAGLIAFGVLVLAIAQLPSILILAPVIFYVFSVSSTTVAIVFMIWCIVVNFTDMVLKPFLLGRGVDAPMLVILLGAIGGMILSGIVGLFTGAVILALGYKLLQAWLAKDEAMPEVSK